MIAPGRIGRQRWTARALGAANVSGQDRLLPGRASGPARVTPNLRVPHRAVATAVAGGCAVGGTPSLQLDASAITSNHSFMGNHQDAEQRITEWLTGRLPEAWFESFTVTVDREEIMIVGRISAPEVDAPAALDGRIKRFREETREERIEIASELESQGRRKVAWGVSCGDTTKLFTRLAVPVMTRLAQPDRRVLDTLVEAGVARSRAEALAWCVKLVRQHQGEWLDELADAMSSVRKVRERGPDPT